LYPRTPNPAEASILESALVSARQQRPYYARALSALTPLVADGLGTVAVDKWWRLYGAHYDMGCVEETHWDELREAVKP
jgi:hypothetical protein